MKLFGRPSRSGAQADLTAEFDMLRARLEVDVVRPAVIAVASSTVVDGAGVMAHVLARSLAATGYPTLYIETSPDRPGKMNPPIGKTLAEVTLRLMAEEAPKSLSELNLSDPALQKRTSQRDVASSLTTLRTIYDYIVVDAERGLSNSFATSVVAASDAVIVAVKSGRRQTLEDARLAEELERLDDRFLGIIAVSASAANACAKMYAGSSEPIEQRIKGTTRPPEYVRRGVMESAP